MTMFRSQTDEQLAARWDDEPWKGPYGHRTSGPIGTSAHYEQWTFAPRVECIPSRDIRAWIYPVTGSRYSEPAQGRLFEPRPEFARPPVSGLLVTFRQHHEHSDDQAANLAEWIEMFNRTSGHFTHPADMREHLRKVLNRLAAMSA